MHLPFCDMIEICEMLYYVTWGPKLEASFTIFFSLYSKFHGNHKMFLAQMYNNYHFKNLHMTHWGQLKHMCVSKLTIIGSDVVTWTAPAIWTDARILLIGPSGTNFSGILIEIHTFSFKKMHLKMSSRKWLPFCRSLNALTYAMSKTIVFRGPSNKHTMKRYFQLCIKDRAYNGLL